MNSGCFKKGNVPWNSGKKGTYSLRHPGQFKKGMTPWNKGKHPYYVQGENHPMYGKHLSEEHKKKLSLLYNGKHHSPSTEFKKGHKSILTGQTKETNPVLAIVSYKNSLRKGPETSMWGRHHSEETKRKIKQSNSKPNPNLRGENHPNWKGGITPLTKAIRRIFEYKQWRELVFKHDDYTCVLCNKKGGYLEADHFPKQFAQIYHENKIESVDDAIKCQEFWNINNGRTLCLGCHRNNR